MRTPEQWEQIKEIFHSAIGLKSDERASFLAKACSGDDSMRSEVESLLAAHEKDGSFIDSPAYQAATDFLANNNVEMPHGFIIGSFEILSMLGKGGMGQVYLAQDKRLGRKVALKFLPSSFSTDSDSLRRFEQEARAASALNHPNILTIHEIGKFDGRQFIATEFIDGVTLRHTLISERLSLVKVLDIGMQICSALNAAHQAGIIHRDIKPENIMLRRDGYVKVLDFGLAKLMERKSDDHDAEASTRQIDTAPGVILGTVNYMAPEQARGETVDETADIWALGVVLYEMATGSVPFSGPTSSHVIVSILEEEPLWNDWPSGEIGTEFKWIVKKALRKDKEERHQSARELLGDLKSLKQRVDVTREFTGATKSADRVTRDAGSPSTHEVRKSTTEADLGTTGAPSILERIRSRRSLVILAILLTIIAATFGLYKFASWQRSPEVAVETPSDPKAVTTKQITTWSGLDIYPSLSPDGNSVTYSSDRNGQFEIYTKQLTPGGREIQLTTDGGQNLQPTWSPDGKMIAYTSKTKGGIWVIPAFGGTSRQLTEFGASPAWSSDGSSIAFQSASIGDDIAAIGSGALLPSTIWTIAAHGGNARQITKVGEPAGGHGSPSWSPDGKRIVFGSYDPEQTDIWTISATGTDLKRIAVGVDPIYAPDGTHIYFASFGANLNLGVSKIKVSEGGDPQGEPVEIARTGSSRVKRLTITANGDALAYGALTTTSNLWSVPVSPLSNEATGSPVALTRDTSHRNSSPSVSPDGKRIAYHVLRVGTRADIWMIDADGANPTQLTTDPGSDMRPSWFADGKQLVFLSRREGKDKLWTIDLPSGRENTLLDIAQDMTFPQLSPDGKLIVFNSKKSGTTNLWIVPTEGSEPKQLTFDKQTMGFGCWSPDGQFIAFEIKRGDDTHLGLIPASGGEPVQLTFDRGQSWPHSFSPDGDKIAFAGFREGFWNVWWISRSNGTQKRLTNNAKLNTFVRYPSWSPLGDQIVYEYAETTGNIWLLELR